MAPLWLGQCIDNLFNIRQTFTANDICTHIILLHSEKTGKYILLVCFLVNKNRKERRVDYVEQSSNEPTNLEISTNKRALIYVYTRSVALPKSRRRWQWRDKNLVNSTTLSMFIMNFHGIFPFLLLMYIYIYSSFAHNLTNHAHTICNGQQNKESRALCNKSIITLRPIIREQRIFHIPDIRGSCVKHNCLHLLKFGLPS